MYTNTFDHYESLLQSTSLNIDNVQDDQASCKL